MLKKTFVILFSLIFMVTSLVSKTDSARANEKVQGTLGQYIVVLKDNKSNSKEVANAMAEEYGLEVTYTYENVFKGFATTIPEEKMAALVNDPQVEFISEDREVSITQFGGSRPRPKQVLPTGINRINAENKSNKGTDINVAIIDTGINYNHFDLHDNMAGGTNCSTGTRGYADGNGHGTHVAGIVAARSDNFIGVVGVAPRAKLWAVRVLDDNGSGTWSSVICGIDFVTSHAPANGGPITVANMSFSGNGTSDNNCGYSNGDALHYAICNSRNAGVTYVAAAGNFGADASNFVPASYDDAVITVSNLGDSDGVGGGLGEDTGYGPDDTFAYNSNYGSVVDIGAPGVDIYSTWLGAQYMYLSGTSMATPHVSGAVALYLYTHPGASWTVVRDALRNMGETVGNGHTDPSGLHPEPVLRVDTL